MSDSGGRLTGARRLYGDCPLWLELLFTALLFGALVGGIHYNGLTAGVSDILSKNGPTLYGSMASMAASLLGFLITAMSVLFGYIDHKRFTVIKEHNQFISLFATFSSAIRWLTALMALSIVALVFEHTPIFYACGFCAIAAVVRLARCVWLIGWLAAILAAGKLSPPDPTPEGPEKTWE